MKSHPLFSAVVVAALWFGGAHSAVADDAPALQPKAGEVNALVDVLRFRGAMLSDPAKGAETFAVDAGRAGFARISKHMLDGGSGPSGWRYLLGTSVFQPYGLDQTRGVVAFYNPWVDVVVVTVWEQGKQGRRIADVEWLPGDLVRDDKAAIDPRPLWLRGDGYRPETLARSVVATSKAIERRFGRVPANWRAGLGVADSRNYERLVAPLLALRLYEAQFRLQTLTAPSTGTDARLGSLRAAVIAFIKDVRENPGALARLGKQTTAPMRLALEKINPKTLIGLAPVAYVLGDGHATVFLGSTATADYVFAARFSERLSGYAPEQIEFMPYAAIYQAAQVAR
ncbi:MAG: hypothetical protein JSR72_01010 [Proteobacteria bacterium]|nr:hypothetical protein [Pseudomonadota bacterium]